MDVTSIASASIDLSLSKVQAAAGTMVLRRSMDLAQEDGAALLQSVQAPPSSGHLLDRLV
jgi:hypothetical protein